MAEMKEAKRFRSSFRGYNREDVAAFVEEFNASYTQMEEYYRGLLAKKNEEQERDRTEIDLLKKKAVQAALDKEKAERAAAEAKKAQECAEEKLQKLGDTAEAARMADEASEADRNEKSREAEAELAALRASLETTQKELAEKQEALAQISQSGAEQETLRQTMAQELVERKETIEDLRRQLAKSENEKEALREKLDAMQESFDGVVDAAKQSLDEAQAILTAQNERMAALEKELREMKLAEKTGAENAEDLLEEAKKQAEEIVRKAKNTAQLIQISALRRKDPPQTPPSGAAPAESVPSDGAEDPGSLQ